MKETDLQVAREPQARVKSYFRYFGLALLLLDCLLYATKPDILWAIAILPVWVWSFVAWLCILVSVRKKNWKRKAAWAALWLLPVLLFSTEWVSLERGLFIGTERGSLRVITLNCEGGSYEAAKEVLPYKPDIVLLQESPSPPELEELARLLYGKEGFVAAGPDACIVARSGHQRESDLSDRIDHTIAEVDIGARKTAYVVSLRLTPPVFNINFLNPETYKALSENRRLRREELARIRAILGEDKIDGKDTVLLGGDFNTPPDPSVQNVLRPMLEDAFNNAGVGWGNSAVNEYPMVRIDQIWHSKDLSPKRVWSVKTIHSDHRMVIADFDIK